SDRKTIAQIVAESEGPSIEQVQAKAAAPAPEARPIFLADGSIDFDAIYQLAGVVPQAFGADEVLSIISQFPESLPLEAKRSTMKITLGAMAKTTSISTEQVISDATRKLAALATYSEDYKRQAGEYTVKAQERIKTLEDEISKAKAAIANANANSEKVMNSCEKEADRLDDVLEFFSLDVGASKYSPPKLP
ncbi:MAG: hypothetical protein K8R88_09275, partial [Armatimonadetes bacterium]|nr:hypothetical protein [Armatimonadota bacterium]